MYRRLKTSDNERKRQRLTSTTAGHADRVPADWWRCRLAMTCIMPATAREQVVAVVKANVMSSEIAEWDWAGCRRETARWCCVYVNSFSSKDSHVELNCPLFVTAQQRVKCNQIISLKSARLGLILSASYSKSRPRLGSRKSPPRMCTAAQQYGGGHLVNEWIRD